MLGSILLQAFRLVRNNISKDYATPDILDIPKVVQQQFLKRQVVKGTTLVSMACENDSKFTTSHGFSFQSAC